MTGRSECSPPSSGVGADRPHDSAEESCPLAKIVSISWLDGDDNSEVSTETQWVNLPKEAKWVDGTDIKNEDRLGMKPRLKVKFDINGNHPFKVKLLPPTGTAAYTDTEKARNSNFRYTEIEENYTTDADGTKIIDGDFELVAGGGYEFQAQAKDERDNIVNTGNLITKRMFFYVEARMSGLTSILGSTAPVEAEYHNHFFKLKKQSPVSIARQNNIGTGAESDTLANNVTAAVNGDAAIREKKPYLLTVAYTDHLAVKNANVTISKNAVNVGPGRPRVTIPIVARGLRSPHSVATRYLWHDLVPGESWFVEAKFYKNGGGVTAIPASKVAHKGVGDFWNEVEVDVTGLTAGVGRIEIKVNVVDRMRGGLAISGANTCVCTRAWWRNQSDSKQECTIIHELGHKIGMVADGSGNRPDKVATHYSGKGHVGDHCYKGCAAGQVSYDDSASLRASQCVIFGAVNQKNAYCTNCEKAVKKLDINAGW